MLYKFKSKATGDLIMLEPHGKHILQLIGKETGITGIILPSEMMAAIGALNAAVEAQEAAAQCESDQANGASSAEGPHSISLKQRAAPFIDMLQRAYAEDKEVVWGV